METGWPVRKLWRASLVLWLGACGGSSSIPRGAYPAVDDAGCAFSCAGAHTCGGSDNGGGEAVCVPWPYVPTCLATCSSDSDCSLGLRCLWLTTEGLPTVLSGVCAADAQLHICGRDRACPTLTPVCQDANNLKVPLKGTRNLCGYEVVSCPNGCAHGACS